MIVSPQMSADEIGSSTESTDELLMSGRIELGQRVIKFALDRGETGLVGDLLAGVVGDIKNVENLVEVCRDLGQFDRQFQAKDGSANGVQQARTVVSED